MNKLVIGCVTALAVGTGMVGAASANEESPLCLTVEQMDAISAGGSVYGGSLYSATATGIPLLGGLLPAYTQGESNTNVTANAGGGQIVTYAWAVAFGTNANTSAASAKDPVSIGLTSDPANATAGTVGGLPATISSGRTITGPLGLLSVSFAWAAGQQVTIPVAP